MRNDKDTCPDCGQLKSIVSKRCAKCANTNRRRPIEDRFWEKVDKNGPTPEHRPELGPCWIWTAKRTPRGYGSFQDETGTHTNAHRTAYKLTKGDIPDQYHVCHSCDNPSCCNPDHLFVGTAQQNADDKVAKGRQARGDRHASRMYPERRPRGDAVWWCKYPERVARGEQHHKSKLTEAEVRQIRELHASGVGSPTLGQQFGISSTAVWFIVTHRHWKHIP